MADTNLFWNLRGSYQERKSKLASFDRSYIEAAILDSEYNNFLADRADFKENEADKHGTGKRIPYIGWFYRHLEFSEGSLPIGDCGDFIGFIANNKWDYPERQTTEDEFSNIMVIIDEAIRLNEKGGVLSEIVRTTNEKLDELWDYLQTLSIH